MLRRTLISRLFLAKERAWGNLYEATQSYLGKQIPRKRCYGHTIFPASSPVTEQVRCPIAIFC